MMPALHAVAGPLFVAAGTAASEKEVQVPPTLLRVMAAAGVTGPGDVDRLTEQQLGRILEGRTPFDRIELKTRVMAAGIYPRSLPTFTAIR